MKHSIHHINRNIKKSALACALGVLLAASPAAAGLFSASAKVLSATPIIETVYEPVQNCRHEYKDKYNRRAGGGNTTAEEALGGVLGALAGSRVGKGSGRDAAAGVGALVGAELMDDDGLTEGEIIGGVAGGVIGNQVGKGSGKTAATAVGVIAGKIIGGNLQGSQAAGGARQKVEVCRTAERAKKVITGYDVEYEFNGVTHRGVLPYEPGKFVRVQVEVDLLEDATVSSRY